MVINKVIGCLVLSLLLSGCSSEGSHPEKVDVEVEPENHVNPKLAHREDSLLEDPGPIEKGANSGYIHFLSHYTEAYDTVFNSKSLLLDRFTSEKAVKKSIKRKQDVFLRDSSGITPMAHLWHYEYRDSAQLANVLRNWFFEFGDARSEIKLGVNTQVDSEPGIIIINEFEIDVLYVDCDHYASFSWNDKGQSYRNTLIKDNSTVFRIDCDGELIWEQFSLPEEEVEEAETNEHTDENVGENETP